MKRISLKMQEATPHNFERFGKIIAAPSTPTFTDPAFHWFENLHQLGLDGRALEFGIVQVTPCDGHQHQLERHVKTHEVIIPALSEALGLVLACGEASTPEDFAAFTLPPGTAAVLNPGTWHLAPKVEAGQAAAFILYAADTGRADKELITLANRGFEVSIQW